MFNRLFLPIAMLVILAIAVVGLGASVVIVIAAVGLGSPHSFDSHILLIVAAVVVAPEPILAGLRAIAPEQADDNEPLVGLRAIADFATREGFRVSLSSLQKYCAPGVNTGPRIIGHWGAFPMSTRGLVRAWIRTRLRPTHETAHEISP